MSNLKDIYQAAARAALSDGESTNNQESLVLWIRDNCTYKTDNEYFVVLGIGTEMADLAAKAEGYTSEVDRNYSAALVAVKSLLKPSKNHLCFASRFYRAFEILRLGGDWCMASADAAIDTQTGNRFGQFWANGQWNGDMVRDTLKNLGYEII
jgi:hypothetical protein